MINDSAFPARSIEFVVTGEPATKARARVSFRGGKAHAYTPEPTRRAEAAMAAQFLSVVQRLAPSTQHAFGVEATFYMASGIRRDVDNMLKIVLDGLNKVAWGDDYQVTEVIGRKKAVPAGEARTEVRIYTLGVLIEREAKCEHCGKKFPRPPSHGAKKFCSADCGKAHRRAARTSTCKACGEKYARVSQSQRFCSRECTNAHSRVDVVCIECGADFTRRRSQANKGHCLCSDECRRLYHNKARRSAAKGTCQDCGGPTTKKTYKRCHVCNAAAGGRWADRDEVTCPICHSFVADGKECQRTHEERPA